MKLSLDNTKQITMWNVVLISLIQAVSLFLGSVVVFFMVNYFKYPNLMCIFILPFFLLFLLFNISCIYGKKRLLLGVLVVIPILYIAMVALYKYRELVDFFLMIIISYIMFSFSYARYNIGRSKVRLRANFPLILTIVQFVFMLVILDGLTNLYQSPYDFESMYIWYYYHKITTIWFLVLSLIVNFTVFMWRKLWVSGLGILGIVALSVYVFLQGRHFDVFVPMILISFYVLGVMISFVASLVFSGFDFKEWFNRARHFKYRWLTRRELLLITMPVVITSVQMWVMYLILDRSTNLYYYCPIKNNYA